MELTKEQRRQNVKNLIAAVEQANLDFITIQLAVIDLVKSSLHYWFRNISEEERQAMAERVNAAGQVIADELNKLKTPGESMLLLLDLWEQSVAMSAEIMLQAAGEGEVKKE